MRIETQIDLNSAWHCATILGKIIFVPLLALAFIGIVIISIYTTGVAELGSWGGFFIYDESEENQTTDRGDSEMGEE